MDDFFSSTFRYSPYQTGSPFLANGYNLYNHASVNAATPVSAVAYTPQTSVTSYPNGNNLSANSQYQMNNNNTTAVNGHHPELRIKTEQAEEQIGAVVTSKMKFKMKFLTVTLDFRCDNKNCHGSSYSHLYLHAGAEAQLPNAPDGAKFAYQIQEYGKYQRLAVSW